MLQLVQVHELAGSGVEAQGRLPLRLPPLLLLLLPGPPGHLLLQLVQLAALCFKGEEKPSEVLLGGAAGAQTTDLRRRPPSPDTAAPAGWRRCSWTWAPNARKGPTSAPVSVAPPPCEERNTEKGGVCWVGWGVGGGATDGGGGNLPPPPVGAAAVPLATLVAAFHPLNQARLRLHPSQRWRGGGAHGPPTSERPGRPHRPRAGLRVPPV